MSQYGTYIFDLDGTLVDSAPAILSCMEAAVREAGYPAATDFDSSLIGPPLRETLMRVTGLSDAAAIEALVDDFKRRYDSEAASRTPAFPGVDDLLDALRARNCRLLLATNKRLLPTERILAARGWTGLFQSVYAQDSVEGGYPDKTRMLASLIAEQGIDAVSTAYVGDTRGDGMAASANYLHFYAAEWGYGRFDGWPGVRSWSRLVAPSSLLESLLSGGDER